MYETAAAAAAASAAVCTAPPLHPTKQSAVLFLLLFLAVVTARPRTRGDRDQILLRLQQVCEAEKVSHSADGLEAIIFTAEGDMRNALNNLQATHSGFGHVDQANVFKVQQHGCVQYRENAMFTLFFSVFFFLLQKGGYQPILGICQ